MKNEIDLTQFDGHTAGPWREDARQRVHCEEGLIADVRGWGWLQHKEDGERTQDANSRLISAAPALLAEVTRQRAEIAALKADAERYRLALAEIAAIEDKMHGGDWDEIELARKIANTALTIGA